MPGRARVSCPARAKPGGDYRAAAPAAATSHFIRPPRPHRHRAVWRSSRPGGIHHDRKGIHDEAIQSGTRSAAPAGVLFLLPAAHASILSSGGGSFTTTGEVISIRHADGNTIVTATEVQTLTGVLSGIRVATGIRIFHPDGTFTADDSGTFTGTVDGRTGSITISGASSGTGNTGSGQIVGDRGTGGLADCICRAPSSR
jgi:hypothetical protein